MTVSAPALIAGALVLVIALLVIAIWLIGWYANALMERLTRVNQYLATLSSCVDSCTKELGIAEESSRVATEASQSTRKAVDDLVVALNDAVQETPQHGFDDGSVMLGRLRSFRVALWNREERSRRASEGGA